MGKAAEKDASPWVKLAKSSLSATGCGSRSTKAQFSNSDACNSAGGTACSRTWAATTCTAYVTQMGWSTGQQEATGTAAQAAFKYRS